MDYWYSSSRWCCYTSCYTRYLILNFTSLAILNFLSIYQLKEVISYANNYYTFYCHRFTYNYFSLVFYDSKMIGGDIYAWYYYRCHYFSYHRWALVFCWFFSFFCVVQFIIKRKAGDYLWKFQKFFILFLLLLLLL